MNAKYDGSNINTPNNNNVISLNSGVQIHVNHNIEVKSHDEKSSDQNKFEKCDSSVKEKLHHYIQRICTTPNLALISLLYV